MKHALETYRMFIFGEGGEARESLEDDGRTTRGGLSHESVKQVLEARGRLPLHEYAKCRVRYFTDGMVLGSREFVESIFEMYRARSARELRKPGRVQGLEDELYALRDLRRRVFG